MIKCESYRINAYLSCFDTYEALVSPILTPLVLQDPKQISVIICAPADKLHSMSSYNLSSSERIDTWIVGEEIFVDSQAYHHRPMSH